MACGNCGDGRACTCQFTAGTGIAVSGRGSRIDPLVITATGVAEPVAHAGSHGDGGVDEVVLHASQVTAGQFVMARLASGVPDGTRFVRDDGTLAVPVGSRAVAIPQTYGAVGDGVADDTTALLAMFAAETDIFIPPGVWRHTTWLPLRSNHTIRGGGRGSILYNDKTNLDVQRRACLLAGNLNPAAYPTWTTHATSAVVAGQTLLTMTVPGAEANFAVGELVIVGSATRVADVPVHAQLTKVQTASGGTVRIADPLARAVADPVLYKIAGTDASSGVLWGAIENVTVENVAFRGRAPLATTKSGIYQGTFRNVWLDDVHHALSLNASSNVVIDGVFGSFSGRLIQLAMNCYNVTARNMPVTFKAPVGLQAGETQVSPIVVAEQAGRVLLEGLTCNLDDRFTGAFQAAVLTGYDVTVRDSRIYHGGTANQEAVAVASGAYAGFPPSSVLIADCSVGAPAGHDRVAVVGTSATNPPRGAAFRGGELTGAPAGESVWFQFGTEAAIANVSDRTGKEFKVAATSEFPLTHGYRRVP